MKNWERFKDGDEAVKAHEAEGLALKVTWAMLTWLYMDYIPGEPREDYLRRLAKNRILRAAGYKELAKLDKARKAEKKNRGREATQAEGLARAADI